MARAVSQDGTEDTGEENINMKYKYSIDFNGGGGGGS